MAFEPEEPSGDTASYLTQIGVSALSWRALYSHGCTFTRPTFVDCMLNLVRNPNINTSWLFRADILEDDEDEKAALPLSDDYQHAPELPEFQGLRLRRRMVRRLIPRYPARDDALVQTCLFYDHASPDVGDIDDNKVVERTLVVYLPHLAADAEFPFYHPKVRGIAFLHEWNEGVRRGEISLSFRFFNDADLSVAKLTRTAWHLLEVIHRHGQGRAAGYQKRVQHDALIPQRRVQDTYTVLKREYARSLIEGWVESTDPEKHVFEDLSIAAFLIELWADMYPGGAFPGFVDIGCGNGLLVHILNREGYTGWGFDARRRKSWTQYNIVRPSRPEASDAGGNSLQQLLLLPPPVSREGASDITISGFDESLVHDGHFPKGTFIISNHADELTPWTPILAAISDCPFIAIPCCSHDLTGKKVRYKPPKGNPKAFSSYAALVEKTAEIAKDCGFDAEREMLRIPSTRNAAIIGRKKISGESLVPDIDAIVQRYGGTDGYLETIVKLSKRTSADNGGGH